MIFFNWEYANPEFLYLLFILIPMIAWYIYVQIKQEPTIQISNKSAFDNAPSSLRIKLLHLPFIIRLLTVVFLIILIARPQTSNSLINENIEGIDIVIAIDISSSMLAEDLKPNRLKASKKVASEFIFGRPNDNIGLVVFSGESFTQCPLTSDHKSVVNLLYGVECGMIEDGTAIGIGLANAVNRIKESQAISRVIILLTDGTNNMGYIDPISAAELAKAYGIRVYTIGVGTKGVAPFPFKTAGGQVVYQNVSVDIDESTLEKIASITGGSFFRATDNQKLKSIYEEIDQMEKTKISVKEYQKKKEEFMTIAAIVLALLIGEILIRYVFLKRIP